MTEQEVLEIAEAGNARFTTDRYMTELGRGDSPFWKIEVIGEEPCAPYVAHGNFNVDRQAVVQSVLTSRGQIRLSDLCRIRPSTRV